MLRKYLLRGLFAVCACAAAAALAVLLINLYVTRTAKKHMYALDEACDLKADCILVLGAGLKPDGTPNLMLRDRLDYALALFESGVSDKLLLSGDHGSTGYDEVNAMKAYLVERGIPADSILLDHAGFSTYDSVYRAKAVFCSQNPVIVTQKYHLYRAVYTARSLGLDARGVSSDPFTYAYQYLRDMREYVARVKDFFLSLFQPRPTYLGDPIPVSTSPGSLTDG